MLRKNKMVKLDKMLRQRSVQLTQSFLDEIEEYFNSRNGEGETLEAISHLLMERWLHYAMMN